MDGSTDPTIVPLDDALKQGDNNRISQDQIFQRGVDLRSGNIIVKDASFPRVFLGSQPGTSSSFYGIKISKQGYDVNTASDDQLSFNSDRDVLQVVGTGTIVTTAVSTVGGAGIFTTAHGSWTNLHGLGYKPVVVAFGLNGGTYYNIPYSSMPSSAGTAASNWSQINVQSNSTTVQVTVDITDYNSGGASTFPAITVNYYLLKQSVTL